MLLFQYLGPIASTVETIILVHIVVGSRSFIATICAYNLLVFALVQAVPGTELINFQESSIVNVMARDASTERVLLLIPEAVLNCPRL